MSLEMKVLFFVIKGDIDLLVFEDDEMKNVDLDFYIFNINN